MPKFTRSSEIKVSDMLFNSGIKDWHKILNFTMFEGKESGIMELNQGLAICVDEKGTDASAISSGVFIDTATPDSGPSILELKIDRPFYFFIQEFSTDAMIMSGRISNL
ncbi:serpin family protein [bacterium]|nr:serpin family protein [bacterium]